MTLACAEMDYELPSGFRFAAAAAGIRKTGRLDVGMICADHPCSAAAVFTVNRFCAAPVKVSRELLDTACGVAAGVVANSGCANAATGDSGMHNARRMAETAAGACNHAAATAPFLVCSTGVIGVQLPMDRITNGTVEASARLAPTREAFHDFARSILTTDTREKIAWSKFDIAGRTVRIVMCAKGSGMIHPRMATLLAFVATDAAVAPPLLRTIFADAAERSLNCMTVDGDTSTNDTAIILASGQSGVEITEGSPDRMLFQQHLLKVMQSVTRQLARDGEGATKLIEITVTGAGSFPQARQAALAVANSPLVKTAVYGRDANWGRIACALGNSGVAFDPLKVCIRIGPLVLFREGTPLPLDEEAALRVLSEELVAIQADLGGPEGSATVWTCDLTEKYIEINGAYRT